MRPTKDEYFMSAAKLAATRSTCCRRMVGCVLVNSDGHQLSTGYNGNPKDMPHCIDEPCEGAQLPSGTGLDLCEAIHAEINALSQCKDIREIDTVYVTTSPCISCTKSLLNTGAKRIMFAEKYSDAHDKAREMWEKAGRVWEEFLA